MAVFVINEWLWADSSGENGQSGQRKALALITGLAHSDHKIVIIVGSAFDQKAWACCKSRSAIVRLLAGTFVTTIRQNSDRCRLIQPESAADLPDDLASSVNPDDHYLIRAQLSVDGAVLITTDAPLRTLISDAGLQCLSPEEFIGEYFPN